MHRANSHSESVKIFDSRDYARGQLRAGLTAGLVVARQTGWWSLALSGMNTPRGLRVCSRVASTVSCQVLMGVWVASPTGQRRAVKRTKPSKRSPREIPEGLDRLEHPVSHTGVSEPAIHADLEDFFENGAIPLHLVGPDGTILKANRAELELLGYAAEEYVGHNVAEFHADRATSADILRRLSRGEVIRRYEARLRAKDGTIKDVLIDSSAHFEDGKLINTRCFTQDFTGQKALESLGASERAAREHAEQLNRAKDQFLVTLSHELRTPLNA